MVYVIYHDNCFDGFGAAWVMRRGHANYLDGIMFIPAKYGDPVPQGLTAGPNDYVYLVDFSYPRDTMVMLGRTYGDRITCLDHHKTAQAACEGLSFCTFDMERSGARLAWDHLFPGEAAPLLIQYIQDRDLGRWKLPFSRPISAWIASWPREFEVWDVLAKQLETNFDACAEVGGALLRFERQKVKEMCNEATWTDLGDGSIPVVNCPYNFGSDVANELLTRHGQGEEGAPYAAYYFDRADGEQQWGLRSLGFDVSEVAKRYGGGGHQRAAGFVKGKRTRC